MHILFLFITILLGWALIDISLSFVCAATAGIFDLYLFCGKGFKLSFFLYVAVGYYVMARQGIKSPLQKAGIRGTSLKLFFLDIYYSLWWPWYLFNPNKSQASTMISDEESQKKDNSDNNQDDSYQSKQNKDKNEKNITNDDK